MLVPTTMNTGYVMRVLVIVKTQPKLKIAGPRDTVIRAEIQKLLAGSLSVAELNLVL